jgi:hypothetical protein
LDPGWKKFRSGMEKIWIRDKHPGSATLAEKHIVLLLIYGVVFQRGEGKRRQGGTVGGGTSGSGPPAPVPPQPAPLKA